MLFQGAKYDIISAMAFQCDNCSKGIMIGRQHKHHPGVAGGRWKRRAPKTPKTFKPNLHVARLKIAGGNTQKMKLCTKCLRIWKNAVKQEAMVAQAPAPTISA